MSQEVVHSFSHHYNVYTGMKWPQQYATFLSAYVPIVLKQVQTNRFFFQSAVQLAPPHFL